MSFDQKIMDLLIEPFGRRQTATPSAATFLRNE